MVPSGRAPEQALRLWATSRRDGLWYRVGRNTAPCNRVFTRNLRVLYFFLQIGSHVSRTPLSITNLGRGHTSLGPLLNLQAVIQVPKLPKKCKKDEIFGSNVEIFEVSCKNLAAAEMSNR
jgi:hypothetical protein